MTQKPRNGEGGFTLIELMVILAVMGILAAVVGVGVVRIKSKRADIPFGGLRTASDLSNTQPFCDISQVEELKRLSPEQRKVLAPTYAERMKKDQERKEALEATLKDLEAEEAALYAQPASAERKKKIREFGERVSRTLDDLDTVERFIKNDEECVRLTAADTASPVPAQLSPTPTPASTRTPVLTQPKPLLPTPAPATSTRTPATASPSSPMPAGVEPPHVGPPDSG